jgi:pantothenate kinase
VRGSLNERTTDDCGPVALADQVTDPDPVTPSFRDSPLTQQAVEALGTVKDKGAPHTFEGGEFVKFLKLLKSTDKAVSGPGYSRKIEDVVEDAFTVSPDAKVLVTEGNYLLLGDPPWGAVKSLLDLAVFIDVPREMVRNRLMERHSEEGLFTEERNREHIARVDLPNYDLVVAFKPRAHLVINLLTER